MKRAGDQVEVIIKVHSDDGEVYLITDKNVHKVVKDCVEVELDKIDWKQQPHTKDVEPQLDI